MRVIGIDLGSKEYNAETTARIEPNGKIHIESIIVWNNQIELTRTEYRRVDGSPNEGPLTDDLR